MMGEITAELIAGLTAHIAAAGLDPNKWQAVVQQLHQASNGTRAHIFGHDLHTGQQLGMLTAGYDDAYLASYAEHYGSENAWIPGFLAEQTGSVIPSGDMLALDVLKRTRFYNEWVLPQDDICAGGGAVFYHQSDRFMAIGGNIRSKDAERTEQLWLDLLRLCMPHIQTALEMNRILAGTSLLEHEKLAHLSRANAAVFILNMDGRLKFACPKARRLLENESPFRLDMSGILTDRAGKLTGPLVQLRRAFNGSIRQITPQNFRIEASGLSAPYYCHAIPLYTENLDVSPFGHLLATSEPSITLIVQIPIPHSESFMEILKTSFDLTSAEASVAILLAEGKSPKIIAQYRSTSVHTVRNQIRALMSKFQAERVSEIMLRVDQISRGRQG